MVSMRGDRRVIVDVNDEIEKGGSASRSLSGRSYHVDRWFRQAVVRLGFSLRAGCRARHSLSIGGLGIPHWSSPARPRCTRFRRRRCVDGGATDTVGSAPAKSLNPSRSESDGTLIESASSRLAIGGMFPCRPRSLMVGRAGPFPLLCDRSHVCWNTRR